MRHAAARAKIHPIIIIPGITATGLTDWYPASPETIWSPLRLAFADYAPMMLHPSPPRTDRDADPRRYEAIEPALVRPAGAFGIIYDDLVADLRHNLSSADIPVQPVYTFAYDWRQDNLVTIRLLAAFIDEVIERTRLMPHDPTTIDGEVCDAVDLIGHSMGGNIIAAALASGLLGQSEECKVRRVVTLGTPFRGAATAIAKLATGLGSLTGRAAKERERTAARVTPSVYQLLPTYHGAIVRRDAYAATTLQPDFDLLRSALAVQPSILSSLADLHRLHDPTGRSARDSDFALAAAERSLADMLRRAASFTSLVQSVRPDTLRPGGAWLALVGAGEPTHVSAEIVTAPHAEPAFDFTRGFSGDSWDGRSTFTGDDTVPLASATPPWEESWRDSVVLRRADFDWLGEMGDRVLRDQLGLHATLPLLNLAHRWIVNFLRPHQTAAPSITQHGKLWARPLPAFWESESGVQVTRASRRSSSARAELARATLEKLWSPAVPSLRLSNPPEAWPLPPSKTSAASYV